MKDPKEQTDKVLHPPYTGARGELYEILWKYASGGGGEESRIPCDEIDNIITDILKLQAGKCHCGGYPDCICDTAKTRKSDPHNDVYGPGLDNYGRDKLLYGPDPAIKLMKDRFSNQEIVNEAMDLASKKCGKQGKTTYTLNCSNCEKTFYSEDAFPEDQLCNNCFIAKYGNYNANPVIPKSEFNSYEKGMEPKQNDLESCYESFIRSNHLSREWEKHYESWHNGEKLQPQLKPVEVTDEMIEKEFPVYHQNNLMTIVNGHRQEGAKWLRSQMTGK